MYGVAWLCVTCCVLHWLQKETTEVRLARMEVETKLQGLRETLRADLGRRREELQDALAAAEADVDECAPSHPSHSIHTPHAQKNSPTHTSASQS